MINLKNLAVVLGKILGNVKCSIKKIDSDQKGGARIPCPTPVFSRSWHSIIHSFSDFSNLFQLVELSMLGTEF